MLVFLLLVVTSTLCYYLGILSILMALVSILGRLALLAFLVGSAVVAVRWLRRSRLLPWRRS